MEATFCHAIVFDPKGPCQHTRDFSQTPMVPHELARFPANRIRYSVYHHIFLTPGQAAQPISQPRPEEMSDIERCAGRCACFGSCKARIELRGKIGDQAAAKLEDQARTRKLGERALQAVFHRHENSGVQPPGLRYQAIEDFTLGPRAHTFVAAGAANDPAQRSIVALDDGGPGEARLDRAELYP